MDDQELERRMREGLEGHAARADVQPAARLAAAARRDARGVGARSWRAAAGIGLAAAAVAGIAFGGVALLGRDDGIRSGGRVVDEPTETVVTGWRTEHWRDVQVDVPEDWGWGGAPQPEFGPVGAPPSKDVIDCGAYASIGADGTRLLNGDDSMPYVGRPILQSDACQGPVGEGRWRPPTAPYVWLGAPVQPGTVEFRNGYVMETREVNGSTVSVATEDPALRERILGSATGSEGCLSEYEQPPKPDTGGLGDRAWDGMRVCAYAQEQGVIGLAYATRVAEPEVATFLDSFDGAPLREPCPDAQVEEWVVLELLKAGEVTAKLVVQLGRCSGITTSRGLWPLTEQNVAPWAVDGLPAYLVGPGAAEDWSYDYFKGMQG